MGEREVVFLPGDEELVMAIYAAVAKINGVEGLAQVVLFNSLRKKLTQLVKVGKTQKIQCSIPAEGVEVKFTENEAQMLVGVLNRTQWRMEAFDLVEKKVLPFAETILSERTSEDENGEEKED